MSETSETSDTKGRCRSEVNMGGSGGPVTNAIADAIDRLAADVAVIEAKVNDIMPEDRRRVVESNKAWRKLVEKQRDAAILKRDEALALLNSVLAQCTTAYSALRKTCESRDALLFQRDEARAEVERLRAELAARPAANSPGISDSSTAAPQPAQVSDAQPAAWGVRRADGVWVGISQSACQAASILKSWDAAVNSVHEAVALYAAPQPAAPPAGWLTEEEKRCLPEVLDDLRRWGYAKSAEVIEALLSRSGSPPVVEVPVMQAWGDTAYQARVYRAALDKAGIQWKEVGRE